MAESETEPSYSQSPVLTPRLHYVLSGTAEEGSTTTEPSGAMKADVQCQVSRPCANAPAPG